MFKRTVLFLSLLIISGQLWAHGLEVDVTYKAPVVILKAIYDDHEAIAGAKTLIHPPDYAENIYQSGITDINGLFSFIPDAPGKWIVEIDDESGHKIKETVAVDASFFTEKTTQSQEQKASADNTNELNAAPGRLPVYIKLILGFLIIYALTITLYYKKRAVRK